MRADALEPKMLVDLSSCDDGVPSIENKNFLRTCHHAMMVDVVQKILVYLSSGHEGGPSRTKILADLSSCDDGVPSIGNQKFLWTRHHTMRVDVVKQKILVDLSSGDEGGPS